MILDYSEYERQSNSYGINSPKEYGQNLFFNRKGWCPFCKKEVNKVFQYSGIDLKKLKGVSFEEIESVWKCDECGWWQHSFYSYMESGQGYGQEYKDWYEELNSSILRRFDVDSNKVPINILRDYIAKNNDRIYSIDDKKMEELVGSVFREHYNCDVHIVGKSHDGGKDLILIESDKSIIVQVKRRMSAKKIEAAKEIRELLGTTVLEGSRNSIFVTTADHFSSEAIKTVNKAITNSIVDTFELFDYDRFMNLLNLYKKDKSEVWQDLIKTKRKL